MTTTEKYRPHVLRLVEEARECIEQASKIYRKAWRETDDHDDLRDFALALSDADVSLYHIITTCRFSVVVKEVRRLRVLLKRVCVFAEEIKPGALRFLEDSCGFLDLVFDDSFIRFFAV